MLKSTKQPSIQELLITFDWECLPGGAEYYYCMNSSWWIERVKNKKKQ